MWSIIAEATCMEIESQNMLANAEWLHASHVYCCNGCVYVCDLIAFVLMWLSSADVSKLSPDAPYKFLIKFRYRIYTPPRTGMLTHITDIPKYSLVPWACVGFRWPKTYLMKFLRDSFTRQQHPASPRWH